MGQILFSFYNLEDEDSIKRAIKYSDVVVNLVGRDYDTWNYSLEKVHIEGARRIAKCAREMGVKKLIHMSAMGASPTPRVRVRLLCICCYNDISHFICVCITNFNRKYKFQEDHVS